jgi:hypothetical protein
MRWFLVALACLVGLGPAFGQSAPPHAWLFGSWSGGLFPVTSAMSAEACLSQPVVVFTRDVVLRASLVDQLYSQRLIATARATSSGFELSFAPSEVPSAASTSLGLGGAAMETGFGCESADVLHVVRRGENEIVFPGCRDFPNPLVRCQAR